MKLAVQKNHLWGQILYISLDPSKKRNFARLKTTFFLSSFIYFFLLKNMNKIVNKIGRIFQVHEKEVQKWNL